MRRCNRSRRLVARGTPAHMVPVASAREWAGCLWAMAREGPIILSARERGERQPRTQQVAQRASAETPPRGGGTRDGGKRLGQDTRAAPEAGTRRRPVRWEPTHGEQQEHPAPMAGSGSADVPRTSTSGRPQKICGSPLTLEVISTLAFSRAEQAQRARASAGTL